MHQYLTYAALAAVLLGMVACLTVMTVTVGRLLRDLTLELRQRRVAPGPREEKLTGPAAATVERVAACADVPVPPVRVVPLLGRAFQGAAQHRSVGTGGLAITRFKPGHPVTIEVAAAALTDLSAAALESLIAHELAHVIRYRTAAGRRPHYLWAAAFPLLTLPPLVTAIATFTSGWLALTAATALAYLLVRMYWQRREELDADRFAIALTRDIAAATELMDFYEANMRDQDVPNTRTRRALAYLDRRWLATHPEPAVRLAAMRAVLAEAGPA